MTGLSAAVICVSVAILASPGPTTAPSRKTIELVAHRGESYLAPENTLAAIDLAWRLGADAVEFDCHLTSDSRLIVCHDPTTERTAGRKLVIRDTTLAELRQLDVGRWKGPQFAGQRMPTIDEVLATVPQGKRLFIELKAAPDAVPLLVDAINASGKPPPQFVVVSFAAEAIARVKRALPQHTAFWISDFKQDQQTGTWSPTVEQLIDTANRIHADGISVRAKEPVDPTFVRMVKNAGLKLHVWTIDSPDLARRMIEYGVDGITTNRAAWMREQLLSAPAGP